MAVAILFYIQQKCLKKGHVFFQYTLLRVASVYFRTALFWFNQWKEIICVKVGSPALTWHFLLRRLFWGEGIDICIIILISVYSLKSKQNRLKIRSLFRVTVYVVTIPDRGLTQPPIQWIPGALSLRVKRSGLWSWQLYHHSPNTPPWRGAQLKKKHRDNLSLASYGILEDWYAVSPSLVIDYLGDWP